ncbi:MAG: peptidylprolyl isomerase [Nostocaceae cyanobacterium]|nr:peptidylprolyl isomerase [Nostocaceae cyanobacterium]
MQLKFTPFLCAFLIVAALMLNSCSIEQAVSNPSSTTSRATEATNNTTAETTTEASSVSENTNKTSQKMKDLPRLEGKATVVIKVNDSPITIEIDGTNAPITAGNFVDLVSKGVYDGLVFHRVIGPQSKPPENPFVVQGGDPQSKDPKFPTNRLGTGGYKDPKTGQERRIPLEITPKGAATPIYGKPISEVPELTHKRGAVAMARSQMPDSASSQFYFALADLDFLDRNYAVFGYVTEGMDVVDKITQGDRIQSAKVTKGAENLKQPG